VSAAVSAILAAGGAHVCLNISPHLVRINERIVIDGLAVEDDLLDECATIVRSNADKVGVFLSFHEAITVCAFLVAQKSRVEFLVLEVGLGGRLDSSNVVSRPLVTAVTSIDFDHQHILGSTLDAIAREKAGIARPHVPMVLGPLGAEAIEACRDVCRAVGAPCVESGRDYTVGDPGSDGVALLTFQGREVPFRPSLPGVHQYQNMAVAIVCGLLVGATEDQCKQGVEGVFWPGRLEHLEIGSQRFLLDCAHNPAGVRALTSHLDRIGVRKVTMVFGVLDTKDYREMVEELVPFVARWCLVTPNSIRSVHSDALADMVREIVSSPEVRIDSFHSDYAGCLESVHRESYREGNVKPTDAPLCCIAGSMYMLGAMRALLNRRERPLWSRRAE
jgi:dihydrofolate synthase/folylpolyglutamate synthase